MMFELAWGLYTSYLCSNNEGKAFIIKKLGIELLVNNKKELQIEESLLFKSSKMLNLSFGIPKNFDIRTYKSYLSMINLYDLKQLHKFIKDRE
jgi:hypothetical protein